MMQWVKDEMEGLDLNDERINRRAVMVLDALANVGESTPDSVRTKAYLDGTYRFMNNSNVSPEPLIKPHHDQTIARTRKYNRVLLVQDTTEVDLTKPNRQVKGAGPLETAVRRGFYLHPLVAFTPQGMPLGVADTIHWARTQIDTTSTRHEKEKKRTSRPIEVKESYRWVQMTQRGKQIAQYNPQTQYVGVSDSESDIYEVFAALKERPENYHIVVRVCHDRAVTDCKILKANGGEASASTIGELLRNAPLLYQTQVNVRGRKAKTKIEKRQRRQSREDRVATVEVRAVQATIRPPKRPDRELPALLCNVVEVREIDPPEGETPVLWTLITTLSIEDEQHVRDIVDNYKIRWNIEVFFRTLKSGLGLERMQYQTLERYVNATMLLLIVAWRVQMLTHAAREQPDTPCEEFVEDSQWKPLYLITHPNVALPKKQPNIREFLWMLAGLGGYIKKRGQGFPGTNTVWRGIRRLEMLTLAYTTFGPGSSRKM